MGALLLWLPLCEAFATLRPPSSSSTQLYGLRTLIRNRFRRSSTRVAPPERAPLASAAAVTIGNNSSVSIAPPPITTTLVVEPEEEDFQSTPAASAPTPPKKQQTSLYSLPPTHGRTLTPLEQEFREMLQHFCHCTPDDLQSLRDPRTRALFEGIAASAGEPAVYRAFEVLFQDLYPLRVAGRLVFKRLQQHMEQAIEERQKEVAALEQATGLPQDELQEARWRFVTLASQLNGDAYLTTSQLASSGLIHMAENVLGYDHVDDFLERLGTNDEVSFTQLILGLNLCAEEKCAVEQCTPTAVMETLMMDLQHHDSTLPFLLTPKQQKYSEQYDEMVAAFRKWDTPSSGEGNRRMDVIRGCFVGAENEKVVHALRIVYVDYAALRLAGNTIFGIVSSFMNGRQKKSAI